jgi:hypothetical protein
VGCTDSSKYRKEIVLYIMIIAGIIIFSSMFIY